VAVRIGPYVSGEKQPQLVYTFEDSDGNAIDLSGMTAKFSCREADGSAALYSAVIVGDPVLGQAGYTWTGTEWPTAGHYLAEFWVGNGTNRLASQLLEFDVRMPVGVVPII